MCTCVHVLYTHASWDNRMHYRTLRLASSLDLDSSEELTVPLTWNTTVVLPQIKMKGQLLECEDTLTNRKKYSGTDVGKCHGESRHSEL